MAVIQVRVDDDLKENSIKLFDRMGLDLSSAIRMFLKRSLYMGGLPFDTSYDDGTIDFLKISNELQNESIKNGNSNMSLEEINNIIAEARKEMDY